MLGVLVDRKVVILRLGGGDLLGNSPTYWIVMSLHLAVSEKIIWIY